MSEDLGEIRVNRFIIPLTTSIMDKGTLPLAFFAILFSGCLTQEAASTSKGVLPLKVEKISPAELTQLFKESRDFLLIDVRTDGEYKEGHLPGAIVIPYNEIESRYAEIIGYKDREIVLYCHTGGMGDYAGSVLLGKGFEKVRNLEGGIYGWMHAGGEILL